MIPFPIPWKFILIGLLALAVVVGVKTAFATYNEAVAAAAFEKAEKEKAIDLAIGNTEAARKLGEKLAQLEQILEVNRQERDEIQEKANVQIANWKARARRLEAAGDKCVNAEHPADILDQLRDDKREGSPEGGNTENMSTSLAHVSRECSRVYRHCMVRFGDLYPPTIVSYREAERR